MAREAKGKHKEIIPGKQKNVGVNAKKPRRSTKESRWRRPGTSARLRRKSKDTAAQNDTKPLEKAWH